VTLAACVPSGRRRVLAYGAVLQRLAVPGLFFLLSVFYVPVTRMVLNVWLPRVEVCPPGTRLPAYAVSLNSVAQGTALSAGNVDCEPCEFTSKASYDVPWEVELVTEGQCRAEFCPGSETGVSAEDVRLNYRLLILPFFGPASLMTILSFVVAVPLLSLLITRDHTQALQAIGIPDGAREALRREGKLEAVAWAYRTTVSQNPAQGIYAAVKFRFRYIRVAFAAHQFLCCAVTSYMVRVPAAAGGVLATLQLAATLALALFRPFMDPSTNWLATALSFAMALNALVVPMAERGSFAGTPIPAFLAVWCFINFSLPVLAFAGLRILSAQHRAALERDTDAVEAGMDQEEVAQLDKSHRHVDETLKAKTHARVLAVVQAIFAAGFVAIALLVLAQFQQIEESDVVAATPDDFGARLANTYPACEVESLVTKSEFVGYDGWEDFTAHCCCSDRENEQSHGPNFEGRATELWTCRNGFFKERDRAAEGDDRSIRAFCAPVFKAGFSLPKYDREAMHFVVTNADGDKFDTGW